MKDDPPSYGSAVLLGALYLPLAWFATSVLRGKGIVAFGVALLALLATLPRFRAGSRQPLYRVFFLCLLAAATVGGIEAVLRFAPGVLHGWYANFTLNGYHGERGGIYVKDEHLGPRLKPNVRARIYWNGHWWTHDTNADGYRGPVGAPGGAVFLGDSMIYGHGVETEETLPARFARASGLPTANLGQQGTCLVQALMLLREKGLRQKPRYVFVSSHPTDVTDPVEWYSHQELQRFLSEDGYEPFANEVYRRKGVRNVFEWWMVNAAFPLRTGRLLSALVTPPKGVALEHMRPIASAGPFVPTADVLETPFRPDAVDATPDEILGWRVHARALAEMKRLCAASGIALVSLDLGYPRAFSRAIETASAELGIPYCPAGREVLRRAQAGEAMYLANDGHWTPAGCDAMAQQLAAFVNQPR
jgi:hypothetical protein